jgi:hypothetical protein
MMIVAGPAVQRCGTAAGQIGQLLGSGDRSHIGPLRSGGRRMGERPHSPTPGVVRCLAANYTGRHCNSPGARK